MCVCELYILSATQLAYLAYCFVADTFVHVVGARVTRVASRALAHVSVLSTRAGGAVLACVLGAEVDFVAEFSCAGHGKKGMKNERGTNFSFKIL